jgi:hypothetical protein
MTTTTETTLAPIFARPTLENTIWYGSAMISFLATAEMTDGHYALLRWRMQKGFTPPAPHRHGPEDFYIHTGSTALLGRGGGDRRHGRRACPYAARHLAYPSGGVG